MLESLDDPDVSAAAAVSSLTSTHSSVDAIDVHMMTEEMEGLTVADTSTNSLTNSKRQSPPRTRTVSAPHPTIGSTSSSSITFTFNSTSTCSSNTTNIDLSSPAFFNINFENDTKPGSSSLQKITVSISKPSSSPSLFTSKQHRRKCLETPKLTATAIVRRHPRTPHPMRSAPINIHSKRLNEKRPHTQLTESTLVRALALTMPEKAYLRNLQSREAQSQLSKIANAIHSLEVIPENAAVMAFKKKDYYSDMTWWKSTVGASTSFVSRHYDSSSITEYTESDFRSGSSRNTSLSSGARPNTFITEEETIFKMDSLDINDDQLPSRIEEQNGTELKNITSTLSLSSTPPRSPPLARIRPSSRWHLPSSSSYALSSRPNPRSRPYSLRKPRDLTKINPMWRHPVLETSPTGLEPTPHLDTPRPTFRALLEEAEKSPSIQLLRRRQSMCGRQSRTIDKDRKGIDIFWPDDSEDESRGRSRVRDSVATLVAEDETAEEDLIDGVKKLSVEKDKHPLDDINPLFGIRLVLDPSKSWRPSRSIPTSTSTNLLYVSDDEDRPSRSIHRSSRLRAKRSQAVPKILTLPETLAKMSLSSILNDDTNAASGHVASPNRPQTDLQLSNLFEASLSFGTNAPPTVTTLESATTTTGPVMLSPLGGPAYLESPARDIPVYDAMPYIT
ncbi:hypothetical protein HDU97_000483 [Phlyctochytrium planicorne]|nr:hypothetical protein HDU97_000483 [Phlyctochytrium planicorne]